MRRSAKIAVVILAFVGVTDAPAQVIEDARDGGKEVASGSFWMPYIFKTESMEDGYGLSYTGGLFEGSGSLFAAGYATANESWGLKLAAFDWQLGQSRWFVSGMVGYEDNTEQRFYGDLAAPVGEIEGGSHGSPVDDFMAGPGETSYFDGFVKYTLPIGDGRDNVVAHYKTNDGVLTGPPSGAREWNPKTSGRTLFTIKPFYQRRTLQITDDNIVQFPSILGLTVGDMIDHETNGIELALAYDNRDFMTNPSRGSYQRVAVARDFGWLDSFNKWTVLEAEWSKYFDLGTSDWFRQKVFTMRAWTAYSPSWHRETIGDVVIVRNTPPSNMGATLGGSDRLRSYPTGRFSDKAAIYYTAELRLMPQWVGFRNWPLIRALPIRWWQATLFGEVGRVAGEYDLGTLHDDMNTTLGLSMRLMIGSQVMRFEFAHGDEANQFWFLVGQPF